jgi:hypothetical protein
MYSFGYFPGVRLPEKYPKEYIQYSKHGESLKSRKLPMFRRIAASNFEVE